MNRVCRKSLAALLGAAMVGGLIALCGCSKEEEKPAPPPPPGIHHSGAAGGAAAAGPAAKGTD